MRDGHGDVAGGGFSADPVFLVGVPVDEGNPGTFVAGSAGLRFVEDLRQSATVGGSSHPSTISQHEPHSRSRSAPITRRYRVTPYGQNVLTAAIQIHDTQFPVNYLAAAPNTRISLR